MNIYVGNMSFDVTEEDLRQAFSKFGEVSSARIVLDRETGRPRGFGFVEMPKDDEAKKAIEGMNGVELAGRAVSVNEARPKRFGFGEGGGGGGGGGRRGGYSR